MLAVYITILDLIGAVATCAGSSLVSLACGDALLCVVAAAAAVCGAVVVVR